MIDHNLVTILLSVEWAEKGDEPSLVIDITNKRKDNFFSTVIQYLIFRTLSTVFSTKSTIFTC
jgi:hypothetical protein